MVGRHHQFNGHEFVQTPGDGEGQGSLACSSAWGRKEFLRRQDLCFTYKSLLHYQKHETQ